MDLRQFADHELLSEVGKLVGSHRELTAKLVAHLGEIEERRLHLLAGYPSMFEFCVRELRRSEGEAFRRILAARLGRRFPIVHSLLASGAVHLSALELLRDAGRVSQAFGPRDRTSGASKESGRPNLLCGTLLPEPAHAPVEKAPCNITIQCYNVCHAHPRD